VRTAIDTNVISVLWSESPLSAQVASILGRAAAEGALVLSAPVYAELAAHPKVTREYLDRFLESTRIQIDFEFERAVWDEVADRFVQYSQRRRKSAGGGPRRLLVEFLIGAHALIQADRLFTFDSQFYAQDFPKLSLIKLETL
jgi:predicted nucleic acid-binding protein